MIKMIQFLKPYSPMIWAVIILTFIQTLSELYLPTLMSNIVDIGIVNGNTQYIMRIGSLMLFVAAGGCVCAIIGGFYAAKVAMGFGKILRESIFTHVESFSLHEFDKIGTASMTTRTTNDVTQIQMVVFMLLRLFMIAPLMCIGGIIMAVSMEPGLSWVILLALPVLAATIGIVSSQSIPLFKKMQVKLDNLNRVLRENLTGIRVIRAFNRIDVEKKRFQTANQDLTDTAIRVNKIMASLMPVMMLVMNLISIAIIWFGGLRIDRGDMQVGNLMAFLQYVMQIMFSLIMLSMMFVLLPRASASASRINEVLEIKPEIQNPSIVKKILLKNGYLEFKDVSFSYPGAERPALTGINFEAMPGRVTAIIGGTGSGKSTLINLIPRFYDVDRGVILVDGVDIRSLTQETLRSQIGFVPQKAILFTGTIAENIRYGKKDATETDIEKAASISQAMEFIQEMKDGFNAMIAQGGTNISGGQKQRLSIARALVRRPAIFIFDDSFSALDFKTDAKLRAALKKEIAQATVIIVAQRVSTVMDADQIIVLDEGKIVGTGNHRELIRSCDIYREIVSSQLSEGEIA